VFATKGLVFFGTFLARWYRFGRASNGHGVRRGDNQSSGR
jgi:hypothetical protein